MTTNILEKASPKGVAIKWMGTIALIGMAIAMIKIAIAFTAFSPQAQPVGYVAQDEVTNYSHRYLRYILQAVYTAFQLNYLFLETTIP